MKIWSKKTVHTGRNGRKTMFRLQVWFDKHWKWGVRSYNSVAEAQQRVTELAAKGIKARVKPSCELFG